MNKKLSIGLIGLSIFFSTVSNTLAAGIQYGGCESQYGSGQACPTQEVTIDKTVQIPGSKNYVDNLTINDAKYSPLNTVSFKIVVKNTGSDELLNLLVEDILPEEVTFVSGPGKFDAASRKLSFTIDKLNPGESKEFFVQAKVVDADKLPKDQGITCVANRVTVKVGDNINADLSQFCIQKEVLGETKGGLKVFPKPEIKKTPPTGPEALALIGLLPTGAIGFLLRRRNK